MRTLILSLIYLISVVSAGVLDNLGKLSEDSLLPEGNVERIGSQRLSLMTHNDLLRQKFLLDILQHVNEPSVSKELQQITALQYEKLVGDHNLYNGGIDEQMSYVVELSGNQQLLDKQEVFTIANDEHIRQMSGLYRLLARSRDWVTLQRNILHARFHVNGVLFVNSLLLAIRDRDDTQNLIMPGIHEILPELYLDENVIRRAKDIDLNQLTTSHANNMDSTRPEVLKKIAMNKLLNRNTKGVDLWSRRQLWMPWREMRMEILARKIGRINAPTRDTLHDNNRIVLPVTQSSSVDSRLLTADVSFQSFMHSFINDLCINVANVKEQNRERKVMGSNKSNLARVALERNVVSMLESEGREDIQSVNIFTEKDPEIQGSQRSEVNRSVKVVGNTEPSNRFIKREQVADERRVNLQENVTDDNTEDSSQRGLGVIGGRIIRAQLPRTTAEDDHLLYVNRKRQHAATANINNFRGESRNTGWNMNADWDEEEYNQGKYFIENIHRERIGIHNNINTAEQHRLSPNMDFNMGMPMDWNRQMAMHRQKVNPVENNRRIGIPNSVGRVYYNENLQGNKGDQKLPQVDMDDERLLYVNRRKLNQLGWALKRDEQHRQSEEINSQLWGSDKLSVSELRSTQAGLKSIHRNNAIKNEILADDSRNWSTCDVHLGHNEIQNDENDRGTKNIRMQDAESSIGVKMWLRRFARSLTCGSVLDRQHNLEQARGGELLLHNLQQLMARINLELISLGLHDKLQLQDTTNPTRFNNQRLSNAVDERLALRLNDMQQNSRRNWMHLDRINEVEKRLHESIEQEVIRTVGIKEMRDVRKQGGLDGLIGDALLGKGVSDQAVNILNVLREIILKDKDIYDGVQKLTYITMNVGDPIVLHLLRRIVRIADLQRQQQLGSYSTGEIEMSGVTINDVKVDQLRTFVDLSDLDLINIINASQPLNKDRDVEEAQRMVIAREQRLNHKKFSIILDVSSDRDQRVVVRTFLGPKTGGTGHEIQLNGQRQNFILLDTHIVDLQKGYNQIKRKSRDINWTTRDTTSFTEIYKRVVQALNGHMDITLDQVQGQNCRFPHRLLLPHGRVEGLPMQMLVVITPVEDDARTTQEPEVDSRVCGFGMSVVNVDRLPLGFPMDRPIGEKQNIISLPNVHIVDVQIYHDNKLKVHDRMNDLNI